MCDINIEAIKYNETKTQTLVYINGKVDCPGIYIDSRHSH